MHNFACYAVSQKISNYIIALHAIKNNLISHHKIIYLIFFIIGLSFGKLTGLQLDNLCVVMSIVSDTPRVVMSIVSDIPHVVTSIVSDTTCDVYCLTLHVL